MFMAIPRHLAGAAREQLVAFLTPENLALMVGVFAIVVGVQAIPGADAVADALIAAIAWAMYGWAGLVAAKDLIEALVDTVRAQSQEEIEHAAGLAADALVTLGVTLFLKRLAERARATASREEPGSGFSRSADPPSRNSQRLGGGADPESAPPPPGPGNWTPVNESMSPRAAAYQEQITGRSGQAYIVDGVKFDGYSPDEGLLEAKGPGYANFVKDGQFQGWFTGRDALISQAESQSRAADGTPVTWHVAEPQAATAMQNLFQSRSIQGINVVNTPPAGP